EADAADILDQTVPFEAHCGSRNLRLHIARPLEQPFIAIEVERRKARGCGKRMARIGVAVEEADHMVGACLEGLIDMLAHHTATHRHGARSNALGKGENVRRYAKSF